MDKVPITQIDATVRGTGRIGCEEDQIAWHKLLAAFRAQAELVLFIGCPGNCDAVPGKDILQVAGAVECFGGCPSKFIGDANV